MSQPLHTREELQHIAEIISEELEMNITALAETPKFDEAYERFRSLLELKIQELIDHDFQQLLWRLYRADVDENILRGRLDKASPDKACSIIAEMIIEREVKKLKTRKNFSSDTKDWSFDMN